MAVKCLLLLRDSWVALSELQGFCFSSPVPLSLPPILCYYYHCLCHDKNWINKKKLSVNNKEKTEVVILRIMLYYNFITNISLNRLVLLHMQTKMQIIRKHTNAQLSVLYSHASPKSLNMFLERRLRKVQTRYCDSWTVFLNDKSGIWPQFQVCATVFTAPLS